MNKDLRIIDNLFADDKFQTFKVVMNDEEISGAVMKRLFEECSAKVVKYTKGSKSIVTWTLILV